jgi:hypothetical protein
MKPDNRGYQSVSRDVISGLLGSSSTRDGSPFGVHYIMFMPAILNQGTEEQQAYWLPRAWTCSIIGSYAQVYLCVLLDMLQSIWSVLAKMSECPSTRGFTLQSQRALVHIEGGFHCPH